MKNEAYDDWAAVKTAPSSGLEAALARARGGGQAIKEVQQEFEKLKGRTKDKWTALNENLAKASDRKLTGGYLGFARKQIEHAWRVEEPRDALRTIGRCRSELDDVGSLADARTRLLLRKVSAPPLADLTDMVQHQLDQLASAGVHAELVATASLAVRAGMAALPRGPEGVEIGPATRGKVDVEWEFASLTVRWVLAPSELEWPGLRAKVYVPTSPDSPRLTVTRVYNVLDLVEGLSTVSPE